MRGVPNDNGRSDDEKQDDATDGAEVYFGRAAADVDLRHARAFLVDGHRDLRTSPLERSAQQDRPAGMKKVTDQTGMAALS